MSRPSCIWICCIMIMGCGGTGEKESARPDRKPHVTNPGRTASDKTAHAHAGPGASRDHSISLKDALDRNICEILWVKDVPFSSRFVEFVLKPKTGKKEWIRIEPRWRLKGVKGKGEYITVLPRTEQLYSKNNRGVRVYATELEHYHVAGQEHKWQEMPAEDPLRKLTKAAQAMRPLPTWNAMNTAVLVLHEDVGLRKIKKEKYSYTGGSRTVAVLGESGTLAPDIGVIDEAQDVLKKSGFDTEKYKLFHEAEAELTSAIGDYRSERKALQALYRIGFFRTRNNAFKILTSVWKERSGEKSYFRKAALRSLSPMLVKSKVRPHTVHEPTREALQDALKLETDNTLKRDIERALKKAEKVSKSLVSTP